MSSYPPSENYPPSTQYAQQGYSTDPSAYGQSQAGYSANPYSQPQAGYQPVNVYGQPPMSYQPVNVYGQPPVSYQPVNAYGPQFVYVPVQISEPGRGQAVAGMVLGIISICLVWDPFLGLPLAIIGLILSILGRRSVTRRGMATAGLVLSIVTLVLTLTVCGLFSSFLFGSGFFL